MYLKFKKHVNHNLPFLRESKNLIAVSGGVDSVVLTHLCNEIGLDITLAHCNFNLRGIESNDDQKFVIDLASQLNIETFIQGFDTNKYAQENKISTQMAARELRYQWFTDLSSQLGFDFILTAHHADDSLETFLINLSRGSGLEGLKGIPEINTNVVRPLLPFAREDIEAYAKENNIEWREDASNATTKYLRNKLRHEVIPILKETNPQFLSGFKASIKHLKEAQEVISDRVDDVSDDILNVSEDAIYLSIEALNKLNNPKAYLYFLLKDYGFTEWNDVANLLLAQSGAQIFSKEWRLLKDRENIILTSLEKEEQEVVIINKGTLELSFRNEKLRFEKVTTQQPTNSNSIFVDSDKLSFPLKLKKWEEGDVFYPLGMKGKKKVSKYFKDEKFSLIDKEKTWLLCSNNDIIWIVGHRADNRFKITDETASIMKITLV